MKIRFPKEITLSCVEILVVENEGEECELDMGRNIIFTAGLDIDGVQFDDETTTHVRIWLRDELVALNVSRECFEIIG